MECEPQSARPKAARATPVAASTNGFALEDFLLAPLRIHLLQSTNFPAVHTTLTDADVHRILGKMNRIWSQAGIHFHLESLVREEAANAAAYDPKATAGRATLLPLRPKASLSGGVYHLYYLKQLGPNGIFVGPASFVKDTARLRPVEGGIDEPLPRVSSHELGHALGLPHRQNVTNLMASGLTGCWFNEEEISKTREKVSGIAWISPAKQVLAEAESLYAAGDSAKAAPLYARLANVPLDDARVALAKRRRVPLAQRDGPIDPSESARSLQVEPGMKVELVAAEPLVRDPVALAFDERGRMYVAENVGYPEGPDRGSVALLEDTDGDGRMDKRTVFAAGLDYPNGVMCWRGGVFVTCAPDLYYLKDTNGDGKADLRKVVLTGYMTNSTTQLRVAHPTLGLDGWVHVTSGLTGGKLVSPEFPERPPVEFKKSDSRFDPDDYRVEEYPGAGQFGLCFDAFGRKFTVSNRNPLQHLVVHPAYWARNPNYAFGKYVEDVAPPGDEGKVWPLSRDMTTASFIPKLMSTPHAGSFTSACGISIYDGDLIAACRGSFFTCEPAQNLVQRQVIAPNGPTFQSRPATPGRDFLASADSWFRPVYSTHGPDGAVYVADMYRKIVDHPRYLPEHIRGELDFISGRGMGRIYRVVPEGATVRRTVAPFAVNEPVKLVAELGQADGWRRNTAFRLLLAAEAKAAVEPLRQLLRAEDSPAAGRVRALHLLKLLGALEEADVLAALEDASAGVREQAVGFSEHWMDHDDFVEAVVRRCRDDDARVRFRAALALGQTPSDKALDGLAAVALRDAGNDYSRAAVFSGLKGRSDEFAKHLTVLPEDVTEVVPVFRELARLMAMEKSPKEVAARMVRLRPDTDANAALETAWLTGAAEGLNSKRFKGASPSVLLSLAQLHDDAPATTARVKTLLGRARTAALDARKPLAQRLAALEFVALGEPALAREAAARLLSPGQPNDLRARVVARFNSLFDEALARELLEPARWRAYLPSFRNTVVGALAGNARFWPALFAAIENRTVPPWSVPEPRRRNMLATKNKELLAGAQKAFAGLESGDRKKIYEELKPVLQLKGNAGAGRAVFERTCAACHRYEAAGFAVGPDLSGVRNQPADALLLHIIVPNAEIYPGFLAYEVMTKDDQSLTGILVSETETSVTIRAAQGIESTFLRSNIAEIRSSNTSLMPQELEKTMTRQELADLLAFLKGE